MFGFRIQSWLEQQAKNEDNLNLRSVVIRCLKFTLYITVPLPFLFVILKVLAPDYTILLLGPLLTGLTFMMINRLHGYYYSRFIYLAMPLIIFTVSFIILEPHIATISLNFQLLFLLIFVHGLFFILPSEKNIFLIYFVFSFALLAVKPIIEDFVFPNRMQTDAINLLKNGTVHAFVIAGIFYLVFKIFRRNYYITVYNHRGLENIILNKKLLEHQIQILKLKKQKLQDAKQSIQQTREESLWIKSPKILSYNTSHQSKNFDVLRLIHDDANAVVSQLCQPVDGDLLTFFCDASIGANLEYHHRMVKGDASIIGRAYREKLPVHETCTTADGFFVMSSLGKSSVYHHVAAPLLFNDDVLFVVYLVRINRWSPFEINELKVMLDSMAQHIHLTKVFENTQKLVNEAEQQSKNIRDREEAILFNIQSLDSMKPQIELKIKKYETTIEQLKKRLDALQLLHEKAY